MAYGRANPALKGYFDEYTTWFALLDTPAPPLQAHLWLNTSDSLYGPTPRTRPFDDGRVHVIAFFSIYYEPGWSIFNRIQTQFGSAVDAVVAIKTRGTAGPDAASPSAEAAWLTQYLREVRHFTMPVAIWAGSMRQVGYVQEGHYPTFSPEETPNEKPYLANMLGGTWCIVIDTHGVIRFFQDLQTRQDEVALRTRIQSLLPGVSTISRN